MVCAGLLAISLASQQLPAPTALPPPGSPPVVRVIEIVPVLYAERYTVVSP